MLKNKPMEFIRFIASYWLKLWLVKGFKHTYGQALNSNEISDSVLIID